MIYSFMPITKRPKLDFSVLSDACSTLYFAISHSILNQLNPADSTTHYSSPESQRVAEAGNEIVVLQSDELDGQGGTLKVGVGTPGHTP